MVDNKILRNIKIDILTNNPNEIIDEFIRITEGIMIMNCNVFRKDGQELIWYVDDQWIFYHDVRFLEFWCNYDNYWSIFESKFQLSNYEIQSITKFMLETAFKCGLVAPMPDSRIWFCGSSIIEFHHHRISRKFAFRESLALTYKEVDVFFGGEQLSKMMKKKNKFRLTN